MNKPLKTVPGRPVRYPSGCEDLVEFIGEMSDVINQVVKRINELEEHLELGHYHQIDDPFNTDEDISYVDPDQDRQAREAGY